MLNILENLKTGLIGSIEINSKKKPRITQYQPKVNTIIKEEDSLTNDKSGKYSLSAYKQRLKSR